MQVRTSALEDLSTSLSSWRLWTLLGWLEIRQRYARSTMGPFWLTISMGLMIGSIGVVYGTLFGQNLGDYLPFLSISLVLWTTFAQIVTEGSSAYITSAQYIRQAATPKFIYVLQVVWRNCVVLAHNLIIVVLMLAVYGVKRWEVLPWFVVGLVVYFLNATWIASLMSLLSARFRDLPQVVAAFMQVAFYVTPVIYRPESLHNYGWIVDYNPFAYLLEIVRAPLTGQVPSLSAWTVTIVMAIAGWLLALWLTGRFLTRIPYWI